MGTVTMVLRASAAALVTATWTSLRLGASDADLAGAVADHDGRAEAHVGATLRHLRDALHLDDVLGEAVALGLAAAASASASASAGC
jgi:hypothetical protein